MRKISPGASSWVQPLPGRQRHVDGGVRGIERALLACGSVIGAASISADVGLGQREAAPVLGARQPAADRRPPAAAPCAIVSATGGGP